MEDMRSDDSNVTIMESWMHFARNQSEISGVNVTVIVLLDDGVTLV